MEQVKEKKQRLNALLDGKEVSEQDYLKVYHEFDGVKYEYVNGRLLSTKMSIGKIIEYGMFLIELFRAYLKHYKKSNGRILTEFIFHIYNNYRRPDILILNDNRCDYSKSTNRAHLIIELVSEGYENKDHDIKKLEYQSKEVPYYFVLDDGKDKSKFYQLNTQKQYEKIPLLNGDIVELSLYQGLRFRLTDLFAVKDPEELSKDSLYEYSFGYLRNVGKAEGRIEGKIEGRTEGRIEGIQIGEENGRIEGIKIGEEKGRTEGKAEGIIEIAKNLKSMNLRVEQIIKATGLNREEIDTL